MVLEIDRLPNVIPDSVSFGPKKPQAIVFITKWVRFMGNLDPFMIMECLVRARMPRIGS